MNNVLAKINERQTVKAYDEKKQISAADWKEILESVRWSPTSFGLELYRVVVVDHASAKLREELKPAMWGQGVITQASKLVFFVALDKSYVANRELMQKRFMRSAEQVRGLKGEEATKFASSMLERFMGHVKANEPDLTAWSFKQTYIALGISMAAAAVLGIGSTPMEGFDRPKLEEIMRKHKLLRDHESVAVAVAFGYPASATAYAHMGSGKRLREPMNVKVQEV